MKKLASLFAFVLLVSSCEKEIDYQIPNPGDKIVVSGQLEAGKEPIIFLSTSVYSMSNQEPKTDSIYSAWLFTDHPASPFALEAKKSFSGFSDEYYYTSSHKIVAGKAYRLEVSAPKLEPISASATVPLAKTIESAKFDTATNELTFSFLDDANTANYYWIEITEPSQNYQLFFSSADPTLEFFDSFDDPFSEGDGRSYGNYAFFDDNQFNGQRKEVNIRMESVNQNGLNIKLHSISESYYRFRVTKAANGFSDGIFSEPVQLFSNVTGGYGILSGQSTDSLLVR